MLAPLDFYFDFASPYGYFASLDIDGIAARHGRLVEWHPIMLGAAFKLTGAKPLAETPLKSDYFRRDVERSARLLATPVKLPPVMPMNSLAASRACYWIKGRDPSMFKPLAKMLYQAHWGAGRDLSAPEAVSEIAELLTIDPGDLLAGIQDPAIKQVLKDKTEAAVQRGVFGSPFVFAEGEPFWGHDRLSQIDRWLQTGGW